MSIVYVALVAISDTAPDTTAVMLWHVQNLVAIRSLGMELLQKQIFLSNWIMMAKIIIEMSTSMALVHVSFIMYLAYSAKLC